jgi:uncharacterized protein with FMN-binding domain
MEKQNFTKLLLLTSLVSLAGCQQAATTPAATDTNKQVIPENDKPVAQAEQKGEFLEVSEDGDVRVYHALGSYVSPAATEHLDVKVSIKDELIENVEMISDSKSPKSLRFQGLFLEGVKKEMIGKKISDIGEFTRVNGSSLTSGGFNQAIAEIKGAAIQ